MLFFAIWALVGPLAGILVGHVLTRTWQREQWLRDRRYEEFREILSALAESFAKYPRYVFGTQTPEMQIEKWQGG